MASLASQVALAPPAALLLATAAETVTATEMDVGMVTEAVTEAAVQPAAPAPAAPVANLASPVAVAANQESLVALVHLAVASLASRVVAALILPPLAPMLADTAMVVDTTTIAPAVAVHPARLVASPARAEDERKKLVTCALRTRDKLSSSGCTARLLEC